MRIATYRTKNRIEIGVLSEDSSAITPFDIPEQQAVGGMLALLEDDLAVRPLRDVQHPLDSNDVELLAPIPLPKRNVLCVGKNYLAHAKEISRFGLDAPSGHSNLPKSPIIFSKLPQCVIANGEKIAHDERVTVELDYEAELAVIIGRAGRAIPGATALDHVWGYTIINDVTARDVQKRHKQWLLGKSQDTFCPMGPFAISRDLLDLSDTPIRCWVNGELRQDGNTKDMIFDVPALIESISAGITLYPGDILATGTPAGVGAGLQPPQFLKAGDTVRIEIPPIGVLENSVSNVFSE